MVYILKNRKKSITERLKCLATAKGIEKYVVTDFSSSRRQEIIGILEDNCCDTLICNSLKDLFIQRGRFLPLTKQAFMNECRIITLEDGVDTKEPMGKAFVGSLYNIGYWLESD